jgi:hypothetical protein
LLEELFGTSGESACHSHLTPRNTDRIPLQRMDFTPVTV